MRCSVLSRLFCKKANIGYDMLNSYISKLLKNKWRSINQ